MRSLIWKEWRQNRSMLLAWMIIALLWSALYAVHPSHLYIRSQDALLVAYGIVLCYALLLGSTLVGSEIASGAIADLFSRPVNPWKLWFSKVLFGLLTTGGLLVFAGFVCAVAVSAVLPTPHLSLLLLPQGVLTLVPILLITAAVFFVSLFSSALTIQPFLAMTVSLFILGAWATMWGLLWTWIMTTGEVMIHTFEVGLILAAAVTSCLVTLAPSSGLVFAKGEICTGLQGRKWRTAGFCLAAAVLVGIGVPAIYFNKIIHIEPGGDYRITDLLLSPDHTKVAIEAVGESTREASFVPRFVRIGTVWIVDLTSGRRLFSRTYFSRALLTGAWSPDSTQLAIWTLRHSLRDPIRLAGLYSIAGWSGPSTAILELLDLKSQTVRRLRRLNLHEERPLPPLTWSSSSDELYCIVEATQREPWCRVEHIALDGTKAESVEIEALGWPQPRLVGNGPLVIGVTPRTGRSILDPNAVFYVIDLATGKVAKRIDLTRSGRTASCPDISSDAGYLIYARYDRAPDSANGAGGSRPPCRLILMNLSDDTETILVENISWQVGGLDLWFGNDLFSPDGSRYIVCDWSESDDQPVHGYIYVINIPRNSATRVGEVWDWGGWRLSPSWSPSGAHIAFASACHLASEESNKSRQWELIVASVNESEIAKKSIANGAITAFVWLSDDELLYGDRNALYRVKIDGTGLKKVFPT